MDESLSRPVASFLGPVADIDRTHIYDYVRVIELSCVESFVRNFGHYIRKNFLIKRGRLLLLGRKSVGQSVEN